MSAEDRHAAILASVQARGSVTIRELAAELRVAAVTIRADVRELARGGQLNRVHGGVTWPAGRPRRGPAGTAAERRDPSSLRGMAPGHVPKAPGQAYSLGMVVPHPAYYYPEVIAGARAAAESLGVRLSLGVSRNLPAEERVLVAQMVQSGVDGLLVTTAEDPRTSPGTEAWLNTLPVPVVLAERRTGPDTGAVESVATDHEQGAFLAVRHLRERGRRHIALLQFDTMTAPMLKIGHRQALTALGLEPCSPDVPSALVENDPADLDDKCGRLVRAVRDGQVDAVLIHNDSIALPLVSRLQAAGVQVPGDLDVISYDDEIAALADPPLTAVAPPRHAVGAEAVHLLVRRLQDPDRPTHTLMLRPQLNVRT
ncbi:substrate-binding domain-containing protein [Streptomyces sp. NPDC020917]|uniref:substrate-binding domain-containing protein n=1 Tax=Streptomyces sp. NPDC020917 TaxID=3365102 RepID=UPI0037A09B6F